MRVVIDEEKCCGYAACISVAEQVFEIDADNIAVPLIEHPEGDLAAQARAAAEACPTDAILIEED